MQKLTVKETIDEIVKQNQLPRNVDYALVTGTFPTCIWLEDSKPLASYQLKDKVKKNKAE